MKKMLFETVERYLEVFPESRGELSLLCEQVGRGEDIDSRQNFTGHVTGSGIVIHDGKMLLIFHNFLQQFFQPGGHYEGDASVADCARREVGEETGLKVVLHEWHGKNNNVPFHIDTHAIGVNLRKSEEAHYHHDHLYLFVIDGEIDINLQEAEVSDYKWVPLNKKLDNKSLDAVMDKIERFGLMQDL